MRTEQARSERSHDRTGSVSPKEVSDFLDAIRSIEELKVRIDRPNDPENEWFFDLIYGTGEANPALKLVVSWRRQFGFGIYISKAEYGERPNEVYRQANTAAIRVTQLLEQWRARKEIAPLWLSDMRRLIGTQQESLAKKLNRNQPAISRIERREDVKLSSLIEYVEAMGGRVEMRVLFDTMEAIINAPEKVA